MRCPRCGNENPEQNRFCGMCGTTLLAPAPIPPKPQAVAVVPGVAARPEPEPQRSPEPVRSAGSSLRAREDSSVSSSSISGPSFLGLNDPPPSRVAASKRATLSIDPESAPPASNLHYLLEDEEEHRGSGLWKFILILIALGLAIGFGYLRWKNQGLAWLTPERKPAVTDPQSAPADNSGASVTPASTQAPTSPSITPDPQQTPVPAASGAQQTANGGSGTSSAPSAAPAGSNSAQSSSPDTAKPADSGNGAAASDKPSSSTSASASSDSTKANTPGDAGDDEPDSTPAKPKAEPLPKPRPAIPSDPVSEARKYLYGKGASQDCDRGLRLLKPAANSGNSKAMVEMGALYSAGLCTPRDLPTSYRWFALALRKEPDNQSVLTDLQKLWGEMTQPERQLAMKLSQ